ncbi:MAG: SDR family oxidoreductase [Solirubrobacteraceae bacterium]
MASVVIAGGHGKIALRLAALLSAAGNEVRALIRNPAHAGDVRAAGALPVEADLEAAEDYRAWVRGADAVVFAAGAGPGSGPERKRTVDLGAAVKLRDAAVAEGVGRYLMISSMGAGDPASASEAMRPYQQAKHEADEALKASDLAWTIVRPGGLTDEPGAGTVSVAESLGRYGTVTRDDVAAVLAAALDEPRTVRRTFEVLAGDTPIAEALAQL